MSTASAPASFPATVPQPRRSQKKVVFFAIFFLITAFVTWGKNHEILNPASDIAKHFAPGMVWLIPHAFFAGLALVLGAFQFSHRLRSKYVQLHRRLGYVYVVSVFVGAPIAIPLVMRVDPTPSLFAATLVQTFGWVSCTAIALYCIRNGNIQQHRRWMMRGYPFAMVFTVARMIIPIPPVFALGVPGIETVVWTSIALAAFLPSIFLEWKSIAAKSAA